MVDINQGRDDIIGTETAQFNFNTTLRNFPLAIIRDSPIIGGNNALGLDRGSTLLNALVNAKLIGSRTWSLFWGQAGADAHTQMDGSLVLGGYDAAKTTGSNPTVYIAHSKSFHLLITISAIKMNFPNGTNINILGTQHGDAMPMSVTPSEPIILIPNDIWYRFKANAGGTYLNRSLGLNVWGEVYDVNEVYAAFDVRIADIVD